MDVFGHVGLTLAAVYTVDRLVAGPFSLRQRVATSVPASPDTRERGRVRLDYRLVIVGSLLPDLVDKPLGLWIAPALVNHSLRTFGHSAAFALLLLALSWAARRPDWGRRALVLAMTSAGHLLMDQMWTHATTLLWPALGWAFPTDAVTFSQWSSSHFRDLLVVYSDPAELVGATVVLLFAVNLLRHRAALRFLRSGAAV